MSDTPFWTEYICPERKGYIVDWHATKDEALTFATTTAIERDTFVEVMESRPEGVIRHTTVTGDNPLQRSKTAIVDGACQECNAEADEECRPYCIGQAQHQDELSG